MMKADQTSALLFALGLCAKAGKLVFGVPMVCEALKKQKSVVLVCSASDNAPNSAKRLSAEGLKRTMIEPPTQLVEVFKIFAFAGLLSTATC